MSYYTKISNEPRCFIYLFADKQTAQKNPSPSALQYPGYKTILFFVFALSKYPHGIFLQKNARGFRGNAFEKKQETNRFIENKRFSQNFLKISLFSA